MIGAVGLRNSHTLDEIEQRKLLLHVCILRECGCCRSPAEPAFFRAAPELTKACICLGLVQVGTMSGSDIGIESGTENNIESRDGGQNLERDRGRNQG
ncbi:hypothetical protein EVAR_51723_1 [Eumeta japonica]|uniref:Uncharacterized protein n=1 Tax=Eumeta variegata TaxID=151549 RepID=A0A4C1XFR0_EUMVA|nr:hypothetical protein EVAR_51723_1 [Eumeta japonica]